MQLAPDNSIFLRKEKAGRNLLLFLTGYGTIKTKLGCPQLDDHISIILLSGVRIY
jgi:hypothetical protein